jgi:hypothetical protein
VDIRSLSGVSERSDASASAAAFLQSQSISAHYASEDMGFENAKIEKDVATVGDHRLADGWCFLSSGGAF